MVELLYRGFDGLDVSFQARISSRLAKDLSAAKAQAQKFGSVVAVECNGLYLTVLETGARGGYAFVATTGQFGATWFFKQPNIHDPWGVRVSCNSMFLATHGLGAARSKIYSIMDTLEIAVQPGGESIGRVDYAMDFLAPDFALKPEQFVMHSNARRADHKEGLDVRSNGHSGRFTSVTVGTMPGRQVIIYDKRAEIIAKGKMGWWEIWDATRAEGGLPPLSRECPSASAVWRVELRAGKTHLKDNWKITSWADLDARYGDMISNCLDAIRYTSPTSDGNRSRWPDSVIWEEARNAATEDLFEMRNFAAPDLIKYVQRMHHDQLLARQMTGLLISRAAITGIAFEGLADFAAASARLMTTHITEEEDHYARKLVDAAGRYHVYD